MMSPDQAEAWRLRQTGLTYTEIGAQMGRSQNAVKNLLSRAKRWQDAPSALAAGAQAIGADTPASVVWTKQHKDGTVTHSVLHSNKPEPPQPEEIADAIREGLKTLKCPKAPDKKLSDDNLMAVYTVADLHMGLLTDDEEVGENWDTKKAQGVFRETFGRLVERTPNAGTALLAQLGDLTHTNDQDNVTPQSKHQLDVDSRFFLILRRSVAIMKWAIEELREKHTAVVYCGRRGNHDLTAHHAVTLALAEYYRDAPDVVIIEDAAEFFVHEWGVNMVVLHHGDRAKPERLVHFAAAEWPEIWGRTKNRIALSGHVHHETRKEIGGMAFESVGTIIPRDAYAHSHAYSARRSMVSIVMDEAEGEVSRARVSV